MSGELSTGSFVDGVPGQVLMRSARLREKTMVDYARKKPLECVPRGPNKSCESFLYWFDRSHLPEHASLQRVRHAQACSPEGGKAAILPCVYSHLELYLNLEAFFHLTVLLPIDKVMKFTAFTVSARQTKELAYCIQF